MSASASRLEIDWTRCDGHGLCAVLLPQHVSRDEWGYPLVRSDTSGPPATAEARRAVAACPSLALRLAPTRKDG
jgi:ferredoxin